MRTSRHRRRLGGRHRRSGGRAELPAVAQSDPAGFQQGGLVALILSRAHPDQVLCAEFVHHVGQGDTAIVEGFVGYFRARNTTLPSVRSAQSRVRLPIQHSGTDVRRRRRRTRPPAASPEDCFQSRTPAPEPSWARIFGPPRSAGVASAPSADVGSGELLPVFPEVWRATVVALGQLVKADCSRPSRILQCLGELGSVNITLHLDDHDPTCESSAITSGRPNGKTG